MVEVVDPNCALLPRHGYQYRSLDASQLVTDETLTILVSGFVLRCVRRREAVAKFPPNYCIGIDDPVKGKKRVTMRHCNSC
ncbi:hypothetical protein M404DRAFT_1002426 [Pisolithus tinctorius Marx 270]|uniref:Uncharacterized protein n=1 Tax=Pisolithus tinctorius Marx 270 TaxID=870435 RepID=A0A0C3P4P1_PISTI|nr:hypothetical protein M404DRAFT_1002426 [Pisolithus tinctorius Marx 270]